MAVKNFYLGIGADGNFGALIDGVAQAAASRADGWTVAKIAAGNSAEFDNGTKQASGAFTSQTTTPKPASFLTGSTANALKVNNPLTGTFAATAWTLNLGVIATAVSSQAGRARFRVFAAKADGSSARELTGATFVGSTVTVTTATTIMSTATWSPGAITLNNEYLFFVIAWEITTASGSNSGDVVLRTGATGLVGTVMLAPDFAAPTFPTTTNLIDDFNRAQGPIGSAYTKLLSAVTESSAINSSGQVYGVSGVASCVFYNAAQWGPDVEAYYTYGAAISGSYRLYARLAGQDGAGYFVMVNNGSTCTINRQAAGGGVTQLATANRLFSGGDGLGISCHGSQIIMWYRPGAAGAWTILTAVTDTTITTPGYVGWYTDADPSLTSFVDDFYAGGTSTSTPISGGTDTGTTSESASVTKIGVAATDVNGSITETGLKSETTLIDDFNRADGPVAAGAGAAIWNPYTISYPSTPNNLVISSNRLSQPSILSASTVIALGGDCDLLIDCVVTPSNATGFEFRACLSKVDVPEWNGFTIGYDFGTAAWWGTYYTGGGGGWSMGNQGAPLPQAGETYWLAKRGGVVTLRKTPVGGGGWLFVGSWTCPTFSGGPISVEPNEPTGRWDNLRGGPLITVVSGTDAFVGSDSAVVTTPPVPVSDTDPTGPETETALVKAVLSITDVNSITTESAAPKVLVSSADSATMVESGTVSGQSTPKSDSDANGTVTESTRITQIVTDKNSSGGGGAYVFPSCSILDNFNRADGPLGPNWTPALSSLEPEPAISGNRIVGTGNNNSSGYWNVATFGPDSEIYMSVAPSVTGEHDPIIRATSFNPSQVPNDGYLLQTFASQVNLFRANGSGGLVQIGSVSGLSPFDGTGLSAIGNVITAYIRQGGVWIQEIQVTDTTWPGAGYVGFLMGQDSAAYIDDFGGGTAVLSGSNENAVISVPISAADAGASSETATVKTSVSASDPTGPETEVVGVTVQNASADGGGIAAESVGVRLTTADTAGATESASTAFLPSSDSATAIETASASAKVSDADVGTTSESATTSTASQVSGSDVATGFDSATSAVQISSVDSGSVAESAKLVTSAVDAATLAESATMVVQISSADSALGIDNGTTGSPVAASDSGTMSESATLGNIAISSSDSGFVNEVGSTSSITQKSDIDSGSLNAAEVASIKAGAAASDGASCSESVSGKAVVIDSDIGTAVEVFVALGKIFGSDSGSATDIGASNVILISGDSGTTSELTGQGRYNSDNGSGVDVESLLAIYIDGDLGFGAEDESRYPPLTLFTGAPAGSILPTMPRGTYSTPVNGNVRRPFKPVGTYSVPTRGRIVK